MSEKEELNMETKIVDEEVVEKKVVDEPKTKTTSKKNNAKEKKTDKMAEKFTLLELIEKHKDVEDLFFKLSKNGFMNQFRKEKIIKDKGGFIEPTITEKEFEKVIK